MPKGSKAALWILAFYTGVWRGDVRKSYEFALVQLTRFRPVRGVLRTASTDSIVLLQLRRIRNTYRITDVSQTRQSGGCVSSTHSTAPYPKGTSSGDAEASPSGRSTQRRGDKRSAEADLIASHAPLRGGSHKARQNGPKHYPGDPMGAAAPLVCLSPLSFFKQRKMGPPEGLPKKECR